MRNDIIQLFENCGMEAPEEYLVEGATAKAPQYKVTSPEEFEMLVSQDPTYDSGKDDGKFIDWIFSLWRNYKTDKKNEEKYRKAVAYKQEHPDAQLPPKPKRLSQDKAEDFQKIRDYLELLSKNLKDLKGDISQFKSISDLATFVNEIRDRNVTVDEKAKDNFKVFREAMADGLEVVYNGPNFIIGVPTTYEASSHFKKPVTEWCTAYPDKYKGYMKDYGGQYYIHLNKHTGELYQAHYESDQFKDRNDREINKEEFISKYPELRDFYDKIWDMNEYEWWFLHNRKPTKEEQFVAVKKDGHAIEYIKSPNEELQLAAVKQNGMAIKHIKNPSEEVQLAAVKQNGWAIAYIKNPSEKVQLAAIKQDRYAIEYIKNPSEKVQLVTIEKDPVLIEYIKNPSEDVQMTAIKLYLPSIQYINNPTYNIQKYVIEKNPSLIRYIDNPIEEIQILALKNSIKNWGNETGTSILKSIKNPTENVKQLARQNGWDG